MKRFLIIVVFLAVLVGVASSAMAGELANKMINAVSSGEEAVVRTLFKQGADVNAKDNNGWTALHYAASGGKADMVRILLDKGADVNAKDNYGSTALMVAAGKADTVRILLDNGADVNVKNKYGNTALSLAETEGHADIVQMLKNAGGGASLSTATLPLQSASPVNATPQVYKTPPEGFVGVPWGATRAQANQIMSERGWMRYSDQFPTKEVFKGSFDGMKCDLYFVMAGNSVVAGYAYPCGKSPNLRATTFSFQGIVSDLTEKYGPPQKTSEWEGDHYTGSVGPARTWEFGDGVTTDKYKILVVLNNFPVGFNDREPEQTWFVVVYEAVSLRDRMKNQDL